jgi:tetratricopeptide (TPR) repeat protein
MLSDMVRRYVRQTGGANWRVAEDLSEGCRCKAKTILRDWGMDGQTRTSPNTLRIERYARWLFKEAKASPEEVGRWLDSSGYLRPGELLLELTTGRQVEEIYESAKSNSRELPSLERLVWPPGFLGREAEIAAATSWADDREGPPIAVLHGFGGSGKSTLQVKMGWDFLMGKSCRLRWPYEGVVWVSAADYPSLSLPIVFRAISRAFRLDESPGRESGSRRWLEGAVRQLLEETRVLLLIDNFETLAPPTQLEILKFITGLKGRSRALISSRRLDTELLDRHGLLSQTLHIEVGGLAPEHARSLIQGFISKERVPAERFPPPDLERLAAITQNNPQAIIVALRVAAGGWITLADLLDSITTGKQEEKVEELFDKIIGKVWEDFFQPRDKAVLMAKALFGRPVSPEALGLIAGVSGRDLQAAVDNLESNSFFVKAYAGGLKRATAVRWRVTTHPLAQAFALSKIQSEPAALKRMESRWWGDYAPRVLADSKKGYDQVEAELGESVEDALAHIEKHLAARRSPYRMRAVELFVYGSVRRSDNAPVESHGIGHILRYWGKWDALIRVAKLCLEHIKKDARLIRECALRLLARAHYERREIEEAKSYIEFAEFKNAELRDWWLAAAILYSRAEISRQQGDFSLASGYFRAALKLFREFGEERDLAPTNMVLGGCIIELAAQDLTEAVVDGGAAAERLLEAERYLNRAERLIKKQDVDYPEKRFDEASVRAFKAVIARLRGDNVSARELFLSCEGQFPSISSVVRLKLERALVARLEGNRELAHELEAEGVRG